MQRDVNKSQRFASSVRTFVLFHKHTWKKGEDTWWSYCLPSLRISALKESQPCRVFLQLLQLSVVVLNLNCQTPELPVSTYTFCLKRRTSNNVQLCFRGAVLHVANSLTVSCGLLRPGCMGGKPSTHLNTVRHPGGYIKGQCFIGVGVE